MKVLITEFIWPEGLDRIREYAEVDYDQTLWRDEVRLLQKAREADALIVRNQTRVDRALLQAGSNLKVIGRLGVGLDNIDLDSAGALRIKVVYAKNANAVSVAEYVMAAMLAANRPLHAANRDVKAGNWDRKRFTGMELYTKTVGLVGIGEIAHRVAKRALAFGMQVIGYDPFVTPFDFPAAETGIGLVSFADLLQTSDYISIHVPLTSQTKAMLSTREFQQMKQAAYLINTSRGGIIDEAALLAAVTERTIAGAVLDVLEKEPADPANPLLHCENVTVTPHIAGVTEESQTRTAVLIAEEIGRVLRGEPSVCQVR
ncbi:hydroxyacid dehydrogenase [Brevibacillus sp. B_LB10_24]|uniref:hydroxyacid dehydrogenase n=1 Tax=Brevibacillus sp. B_LB10_24 TaxID=3380645 RepID=UPI0038BC5150